MAQTIKFVYESGKIRIQKTHVDLTLTTCKELQHDHGEKNDAVKYFVLTDGQFAPEEKKYNRQRK